MELDAERARLASASGIEMIQGNTFDAVVRSESFSLLYLNPPYDSEIGSIANRRISGWENEKLTTPARKEDEADGECTPAARAA